MQDRWSRRSRCAGLVGLLMVLGAAPLAAQDPSKASGAGSTVGMPGSVSTGAGNAGMAGKAPAGGILMPATAPDLIGKPAPDFQASLRSGVPLGKDALRGKVVVLNFWATWCPPCIEELPSLERLRRQLKGLPVEIVGLSVDDSWEPIEKLTKERPIRFTLALDIARSVPGAFGTEKFPETYILDKNGVVVRKLIGAQIWDRGDFVAFLRELAGK